MRLPSIKTLASVFGDDAKQARKIMEMSRTELAQNAAGAARIAECYHAPKTYDVRLTVLDALGHSYGVEGAEDTDGNWLTYLNTGDPYSPTVWHYQGKYSVGCLGSFIEHHNFK